MGLFKQWLKKPQTKNSRAFLSITGSRSAAFSGTDYRTLSKEGYERNPYVYSCIQAKVTAAQSVPWKLFQVEEDGTKKEIFNHKALDLIHNPNPFYTFDDIVEWYYLSLDLDGNYYVEKTMGMGDQTQEIYILRPDKTDILYNSKNPAQPIKGYEYKDSDTSFYETNEIIHIKNVNPLDDKNNLGKGQSTLSAGARSGDQNNESRKWNVALLQNGAVPTGIISAKGEVDFDQDQVDIIRSQFKEQYSGADNAGEPLVLGYSEWKSMGMTAKDLDWKEGIAQSGREICSVLKVPSLLVGDDSAKTYANYKEARRALFIDTVIPSLKKLVKAFNKEILPAWGDNLIFELDLMEVDVIKEERLQMWDKVQKTTFLTENEKRKVVGFGDAGPQLDVYLLPTNVQVIPKGEININDLLDGDDE